MRFTPVISNTFHLAGGIVKIDKNLELTCDCSPDPLHWCDHRAQVIHDVREAPFVHHACSKDVDVFSRLPVFPTRGIFHAVKYSEVGPISPGPVSVVSNANHNDQFICVLALNEGLDAARTAVVDLFRSLVPDAGLECKSTGHRYSSQMECAEMEKEAFGKLVNQFSIWSSGMCAPCVNKVGRSDEAYEDAVPIF